MARQTSHTRQRSIAGEQDVQFDWFHTHGERTVQYM